MKSLASLCHDVGIPARQQEFFCGKVVEIISSEALLTEIARECLSNLWIRYDSGGISMGRSLRAALLEYILDDLLDGSISDTSKCMFSVLLGMYHDHEFINTQRWYDYRLEHFHESDLLHRVWLSSAAFCLEIDEVAEMNDWPIEKIRALL